MDDLGEPRSYLAVEKGVPVYASGGEKLGRVVRVMAAPNLDMFDGIVFDTTAGPGGHRFVDAPEVTIPAAVYSSFMLFTGGAFAWAMSRRNAGADEPAEAEPAEA